MAHEKTRGKRRKSTPLSPGLAIYLRTSDPDVQSPIYSQEAQMHAIETRVLSYWELPIYKTYRDTKTGRNPNRPGYQAMLEDARAGCFSHIAVSHVDRFGRNVQEGARAIEELYGLGLVVIAATSPTREGQNSHERFFMNMELALAQLHSENTSELTHNALLRRYNDAKWPHRAPDGYVNRRMPNPNHTPEQSGKNGRDISWIEQDPEQSQVIRLAFDLLLQGNMSLPEICHELHGRGYRLKRGTPFVHMRHGKTTTNNGALSRIFHNWFYAGWLVVDNEGCTIPPKTKRGAWEPIVTTEEFERAQAILDERNKKRAPKREFFYLLQGLVYVELDEETDLAGSEG